MNCSYIMNNMLSFTVLETYHNLVNISCSCK